MEPLRDRVFSHLYFGLSVSTLKISKIVCLRGQNTSEKRPYLKVVPSAKLFQNFSLIHIPDMDFFGKKNQS